MIALLFTLLTGLSSGVRDVSATSCDIIPIRVALGITTQLVFEQPPTLMLYADEEHFKVKTSPEAKRSIAIMPFVDSATLGRILENPNGHEVFISSGKILAQKLDRLFTTNLFVFFKNSNQLMFQLRFVDKPGADYMVNVKQIFKGSCRL
jgi:hypothetical protein